MRLIEMLRQRNPGMAKRADSGSRAAAIRLFCLQCYGGNRAEVRRCTEYTCPLWPYRMGQGMEDRK